MAFLQEPRGRREPVLRVPLSVTLLILALVAVHVARTFVSPQTDDNILRAFAFIPARYSHAFLASHNLNPGSWIEQAVPFVSYIFLHANFSHLTINSLWLLAFGPAVERRLRTVRFLLLFLTCGIVAAATHLALNWGSPVLVIGASGSISGLMGAGIRYVRFGSPTGIQEGAPILPLWSRQVLVFSAVWAVANVVAGLTGIGTAPGVELIAWQAHLGGFLAGLILAGLADPGPTTVPVESPPPA